jgi:aminopeptidase N
MYQTLLSPEGFRKGMDLYFERHDGQAVTCDDFLSAMSAANDKDLSQFAKWYSTNGTPTVTYQSTYKDGTLTLELTQSSNSESPLLIPVSVGVLDKETGKEVVPTTVLELTEEKQTFTFENLKGDVVPSILRQFSAPVKLVSASGEENLEDLAFLAARDTDGFNKWDAGQKLYTTAIFEELDSKVASKTLEYIKEAFGRTLGEKESTDFSIISYALTLPSEGTLAELVDGIVDPMAIKMARGTIKKALAREFQSELKERYDELTAAMDGDEFKVDADAIGRRRLRNVCLDYLCSIKETPEEQKTAAELATAHFENATGMTDKIAALSSLASMDGEGADARDKAIETFYQDANGDALVLNKWFGVQAMADLPDILDRVKILKEHPDFSMKNPNRCRSLLGAYAANTRFHDENGEGYAFLGEMLVELDQLNPQISSRMAGSLIQWRKYSPERGAQMKAELEKLAAMKPISEDLYEIVNRGLK